MSLKRMAILAAVILTAILLSTICYSQGDRPVKVDTSAQGGNAQPTDQHAQGNIGGLTPAPKTPEATAKTPVQPVAKAAAPAPVQRVQNARPRGIRKDHQGHRRPYQHIKSWDPASRSFVDARDQRTPEKANAHTDKKISEAMSGKGNPQGKPAPETRRKDVPPFNPPKTGGDSMSHDWIPLLWILALAAIAYLAWYIWWRYFRGRWITNVAEFWANRRSIGERCADVRLLPIERQDASKQVRNVSAGELQFRDLTDAAENGTDELEFRLENHNGAHAGIPATGVWVGDDLPEELVYKPGSGRAYINRRYTVRADGSREDGAVAIPDWMMEQMLDYGRVLRMNQVPGMPAQLGPRSAWFVVFRTLGEAEEENEEAEFVDPTAEGGPDYVAPDAEEDEIDNIVGP